MLPLKQGVLTMVLSREESHFSDVVCQSLEISLEWAVSTVDYMPSISVRTGLYYVILPNGYSLPMDIVSSRMDIVNISISSNINSQTEWMVMCASQICCSGWTDSQSMELPEVYPLVTKRLPGLVNIQKTKWKITMLLMGKLTINMAIFNSYFDIARG